MPFPDYEPWVKQTVLVACAVAWQRVKTELVAEDYALSELDEDEITTVLQGHLNDLRDTPDPAVPTFTADWFMPVERDAKIMNYRGTNIDKMPDLVFRVHQRLPGLTYSEQRGLFTECKIVALTTPGVGRYCDDGLCRFVNGDYAWAMPSGLMLAYLMDPHAHSIVKTLYPKLKNSRITRPDPYATRRLPHPPRDIEHTEVRVTSHARRWRYPDIGGAPGDVEILHLWLV